MQTSDRRRKGWRPSRRLFLHDAHLSDYDATGGGDHARKRATTAAASTTVSGDLVVCPDRRLAAVSRGHGGRRPRVAVGQGKSEHVVWPRRRALRIQSRRVRREGGTSFCRRRRARALRPQRRLVRARARACEAPLTPPLAAAYSPANSWRHSTARRPRSRPSRSRLASSRVMSKCCNTKRAVSASARAASRGV